MDDVAIRKAMGRALNLISYRSRTEYELSRRLSEKHPADVVDRVIERLKEQGLVDDEQFAHDWSAGRARSSPRSSRFVFRELRNKGVSRARAEAAVVGLDDSSSARDAASRFARRLANSDYKEFHRRLWGHLQRRGYSSSVSRHAVSEQWQARTD